jgi:NhaA family Na+:H+ antiporter
LGILSLLGNRVPFSLKVFLMALAIIDDLGAILIIATFYTQGINFPMLLIALGIVGILTLFNRSGLSHAWYYLVPGVFLWYFILESGIHPTIAGVLIALTIPADLGERFEHQLQKPVNYLILPLFALANTAMELSPGHLGELFSTLSFGIIAGLFLGKSVGITLASWLLIRFRFAILPDGVSWKQIAGLGVTAGIGFTMSIFISALSFDNENNLMVAKLAILVGSFLSAMVGICILWRTTKPDIGAES